MNDCTLLEHVHLDHPTEHQLADDELNGLLDPPYINGCSRLAEANSEPNNLHGFGILVELILLKILAISQTALLGPYRSTKDRYADSSSLPAPLKELALVCGILESTERLLPGI